MPSKEISDAGFSEFLGGVKDQFLKGPPIKEDKQMLKLQDDLYYKTLLKDNRNSNL